MKSQFFLLKTVVIFLSIFFLFSLEGNSMKIGIYLSTNGSDRNSGAKDSTLKSLEKTKEVANTIQLFRDE